jgi:tetratricopeptide (TPR) repeat protein
VGYSILGDALKGISDFKSCLQAYTKAVTSGDVPAMLKRSKLYFELEDYEKALKDTEEYLRSETADSDAYYQKGQILILLGKENDAILSFE